MGDEVLEVVQKLQMIRALEYELLARMDRHARGLKKSWGIKWYKKVPLKRVLWPTSFVIRNLMVELLIE